jgi:hypothetical protein
MNCNFTHSPTLITFPATIPPIVSYHHTVSPSFLHVTQISHLTTLSLHIIPPHHLIPLYYPAAAPYPTSCYVIHLTILPQYLIQSVILSPISLYMLCMSSTYLIFLRLTNVHSFLHLCGFLGILFILNSLVMWLSNDCALNNYNRLSIRT